MADNEVKLTLKPEDAGVFASIKELQSSFEGVGSAISSVVGLAIDAVEKIKQLEQEVRQMRQDFEQAAVSITKASSSLADENLKLQDQIAVLEHRPARNQLAIALVEAAGRARELTSSLFDAINKERDLLENKSVNFVRSLASGQAMTNDLKDQFAPELDQIAEILSRKQIAIAEFNLKNDAILQHGTESQRHAIQNQLQDLSKGFDQELTTTSQAVLRRLAVLQKGLEDEKKARVDSLTQDQTQVYGDGSFSTQAALSQAEAQKQVNEQFRTRQAIINSLRISLLGLMQAEKSEASNQSLSFKAAALQQADQIQVITVKSQKSRIQTVHEAGQEVVADYKTAFDSINGLTQQFNGQQLAILMTGIKNNSTQIIARSQQYFKKLEQDEARSLERRRKIFDHYFQAISGAFTGFINGVLSGHQTLGQSWAKLVNDMASKFLAGLEQQLMGFLEHKLMELTIHASTEKAKDVASKAAHAKEDERTAYSAAKAAWESVVHTPIVGPILAPIAAATTFAAVTAFGSAEGGQYYVPNNQLTMLHPQEMVLPAGIANQMRSVIGGGGSGGSGVTVVVNHSVSAVDAASFQGHIRRHSNMIANEVTRALKRKGVR
jgi:hypothetical protein